MKNILNLRPQSGTDLIFWLAILIVFLTPVALVLSRGVSPVLLVLINGLLVLWAYQARVLDHALVKIGNASRSPLGIAFCSMLIYCVISSLFSPSFPRSMVMAGHITGITVLVAGSVYFALQKNIDANLLRVLLLSFVALTAVLILFELRQGSPLRQLVGGTSEAFRLNRSAVAIAVLAPLLLLPGSTRWLQAVAFAVICLVVFACFHSDSETAKLAIVAGLLVWVFCRLTPLRRSAPITSFVIVASLPLAPVLAFALREVVPQSIYEALGYGEHMIRSEIWWAFANLIDSRPLLGHGFESSFSALQTYPGVDENIAQLLHMRHPHNFAIQVWYELGVVGVALFTGILVLVCRALRAIPFDQQPVALSMTVSIWTVAYVSHGAWQAWWWALVGIAALLFAIICKTLQRG